MNDKKQSSKHEEIRNLLGLIGSGVGVAFLVVGFLIYFYGPTGLNDVQSSLLSPDVFSEVNYKDTDSRSTGKTSFVFDQLEFFFYNKKLGKWEKNIVTTEQYKKFYNVIKADVSPQETTEIITDYFKTGNQASLKLLVKSVERGNGDALKKIFQEVEIANEGDYYRISIPNSKNGEIWAYFHHPKIYRKAVNILGN